MAKNPKNKQTVPTKKHLARLEREKRETRWIIFGSVIVIVLVVGVILYGILDQNVLKGLRTVETVNGEKINVNNFRAFTKYYRYTLIRQAEQTYQLASMFGQDPTMVLNQLQNYQSSLDSFAAGQAALTQMANDLLIRQEAKRRNITVSQQEINDKMQQAFGYFANGTPVPTSTPTTIPTSTLSPLQGTWFPPTPGPTSTPTATLQVTGTLPLTGTLPVTGTHQITGTPQVAGTMIATPTYTPTPAATQVLTPTAVPSITPTPTVYTADAYKNNYATLVADFQKNYLIPEATLRYIIESSIYRDKVQQAVIGQVACTADQVWAEHILLKDQQTAADVMKKLQAGEDWNKLAATYSTDASNKNKGGDLGWFGKGQMVPEFAQAAFNLQAGEVVSQPVKTQFGFHVIRVLGHENRPLTPSECTQLSQTKFSEWLKALNTSSKIVISDWWNQVVPLQPTLSAEITTILKQYGQQQQQPQQPQQPQVPAVPTP